MMQTLLYAASSPKQFFGVWPVSPINSESQNNIYAYVKSILSICKNIKICNTLSWKTNIKTIEDQCIWLIFSSLQITALRCCDAVHSGDGVTFLADWNTVITKKNSFFKLSLFLACSHPRLNRKLHLHLLLSQTCLVCLFFAWTPRIYIFFKTKLKGPTVLDRKRLKAQRIQLKVFAVI